MNRRLIAALCGALALVLPASAGGQLVPPIMDAGPVLGGLGRQVGEALEEPIGSLDPVVTSARSLAEARVDRLRDLVRTNPERLEMTREGPAVRGEVIAVDPTDRVVAAAEAAGFTVTSDERIEGLGLRSVTFRTPDGLSLRRALRRLERIAPEGRFAANHLHRPSGGTSVLPVAAALAGQRGGGGRAIGIIDGGVAAHPALTGPIAQRGFARGAPAPSSHGTAIASLISGRGTIRGAAAGVRLLVADVYGRDPAGGNAMAIARALGWMAQERIPVVAISLVGPDNALVARAVGAAQARGVNLVAAVGNDGPAAPHAYPASYPGVIAVTGVDGRNRPLIEAGRSRHLDYAAPGADMLAADADRGTKSVRGTSFAVPFVAARAWHAINAGHAPRTALDAEAVDLPPRGTDRRSGRGLICGNCRTPVRGN